MYLADTENIQAHIYIHGILTDVKIINNMEDVKNLDKAKIRKINKQLWHLHILILFNIVIKLYH